MSKIELYDGKTPYQILEEHGLLHGLTNSALEAAYHQHVEHKKSHPPTYSIAEADAFALLQKNDPDALIELQKRDPAKFTKYQESYLRRLEDKSRK